MNIQRDGLSILGIAFVILKLMNYITWPWVWVLAPFWIGFLVWLVLVLLVVLLKAWGGK